MNISILIPVSNDLGLKRCINSIDESVEVVISLNKPSKALRKQVDSIINLKKKGKKYKKIKFVVCEIKEQSIAKAYNNGIKHASYDKVLLMDSDCIFKKGCINRLDKNIKQKFLSKGKVIFTYESFITKVVAKAREFHTSDVVNAYSPPLLFSKKIISYIGGYYFHPSLYWLEDSEFDKRVRNTNLEIGYDQKANVFHPPISPFSDLRNSFCYGISKKIGVYLGIHDKPRGVIKSVKKYLIDASKEKGFFIGVYLLIWKLSFLLGYYLEGIFKIKKIEKKAF